MWFLNNAEVLEKAVWKLTPLGTMTIIGQYIQVLQGVY